MGTSKPMNDVRTRYADPDAPLVRVTICGSVDSGKSTLMGRLVFDAGLVYDDEHPANGALDLAMLADGLEAEAEQGITIDVAYRHFATAQRTYLFADAPGHLQYTRNMATAASLASVAIIVVDAPLGITEQTQRHLAICTVMGVRTVIVAINKLDALGFDQSRFAELTADITARAGALGITAPVIVPISAREGDNVSQSSTQTPWYDGPTLISALDAAPVRNKETAESSLRLPVRIILRPDNGERWIAGTIASGSISVGQQVGISGRPMIEGGVTVAELWTARGAVDSARAGSAVRLRLTDHADISRGDLLCETTDVENGLTQRARVRVVWLHDHPLTVGTRFIVRVGTRWMFARITRVDAVLDLKTLETTLGNDVKTNDIADVELEFAQPIPLDTYQRHRETGALIIVDSWTSEVMAAGLVLEAVSARRSAIREPGAILREQRAIRMGHGGMVAWFTGLSGSGKSTITREIEAALHAEGYNVFTVAGDNLRLGLCGDLGFSPEDRTENLRRAAEASRLMLDAGLIVLCEFISPMQIDRLEARRIIGSDDFAEIYVHANIEACIQRDPKGLYKRALAGEITDFTGISSSYEPPSNPDLRLDTEAMTLEESVQQVLALIKQRVQRINSSAH